MKKLKGPEEDNKSKKRREEKPAMSIKEADIKKGWAEMETIAEGNIAASPQVDPDNEDLSDLFAWGNWVAHKCRLTKVDSRRLLSELRKSKNK